MIRPYDPRTILAARVRGSGRMMIRPYDPRTILVARVRGSGRMMIRPYDPRTILVARVGGSGRMMIRPYAEGKIPERIRATHEDFFSARPLAGALGGNLVPPFKKGGRHRPPKNRISGFRIHFQRLTAKRVSTPGSQDP